MKLVEDIFPKWLPNYEAKVELYRIIKKELEIAQDVEAKHCSSCLNKI